MMYDIVTQVILLKLTEAYKNHEDVKIKELAAKHVELSDIDNNYYRVVRYKDLSFTLGLPEAKWPLTEVIHKELKVSAEEIIDERSLFNYDMDRLKHYLSYIERYTSSIDEYNTYVPPALLENIQMHFTEPSRIKTNKMQNIHKLYTEEPKILKRYFLLYQLNRMKG